MSNPKKEKAEIGWREWVALPDLGIRAIKVKIDTGARTSSLHVFDVRREREGSRQTAHFRTYPLQRDTRYSVHTSAPVVDSRSVRSSTGERQERIVIRTRVELAGQAWPIEINLANRDDMGFRMILGRQALRDRFAIDPGRSFLAGIPPARKKKK